MASQDFSNSLQSTNEVELTVTGRKSGKSISTPVWFVQEGGKLYLVPVKGSESNWYKNVRKTPTISLAAKGKKLTTSATPITDSNQVSDIVQKFRNKYGAGQIKAYYSKLDVAAEVPIS